ncbi:SUMF1/EgtB/PvdO family nonheme iron enzyme [Methylobacter sp. G7]|uniref:formylglycine-generating enzyme family protein n=1 Tax=Methylobacter sp. G7 TaxID=3230117 RepID=UPI003D802854
MSENLLGDEHNGIKSFKCIECQLVLSESSRFQDKPVCVTCVEKAGYIVPMDIVANKKGMAQQEEYKDAVKTKASISTLEQKAKVDTTKVVDVIVDKADDKKEIAQQEEHKDAVKTKASISAPEQKAELDIIKAVDVIADKADDKEEIVQKKEHKVVVEAKASENIPELKNEVGIAIDADTIAVENNTINECIMSITMVEDTDWVTIAAGEFMMGSLDAAEDADEQLHDVTVSGFRMLKTAVTFEQFDIFCKETGKGKYSDCKWGRGNRPVIFVSYWDAVDYAKWLSHANGWQCRLPTEAEWEYACRAGTETPFNTGKTISTAQANYDGASPHLMVSKGISRHKTMPTATFLGNAWGLFEMHGNVCEWCASEYDPYYNGSEQLDGSTDRSNDVPRVLRGGSWNSRLETLRSAARMQSNPENRSNEWGFRLVRID